MSQEVRPQTRPEVAMPIAKLLIDFGPLIAFFVTYYSAERWRPESGIYWATGVLMAATLTALAASRALLRRFSLPPLITAVLVLVFGGLTIWLRDPRFVMMKPTIINLIFAGVLAFGLVTGRSLLKVLMGEALKLTDEGWQKLTVRWFAFFVGLAVFNEVVWRNFSQPTWVMFKVGIFPLTLLFAVAQVGLIKRYEAKD
ncbi:MAG: septation protein A [Hyphomicrobiaceae bacterium]|nr:septation protein A [Hyphomicrobiaceae bacterium]